MLKLLYLLPFLCNEKARQSLRIQFLLYLQKRVNDVNDEGKGDAT